MKNQNDQLSLLKRGDTTEFEISHIDGLGQGVSKINERIIFIPKTLPGEKGICKIIKASKGVHFAETIELYTESPHRIEPECPHFHTCGGCDFLHTNYLNENQFKLQNIERSFSKLLENKEITPIWAKNRLNYRNRIQLHYDYPKKKIGFFTKNSKSIVTVPNCKIFHPSLGDEFDQTMKFEPKNIFRNAPKQGHIELYENEGQINKSLNKSYSMGGFTQVNQEMNNKLLNLIETEIQNLNLDQNSLVLDFFGGKGNLTSEINFRTLVVDSIPEGLVTDHLNSNQTYVEIDLFKSSVHSFVNKTTRFLPQFSGMNKILILDPPRSGFKDMNKWLEILKPEFIFYISCNPQTQKRDLLNLKNICSFDIQKFFTIDLFPSTYHLETAAILKTSF